MRDSIDLSTSAVLDGVAHRGISTPGEVPLAALCPKPAADGAIREGRTVFREAIEPWARQAQAANGFGDFASIGSSASAPPANREVHEAARALRARVLGAILIAAIRKAGVIARRALARHRRRRQLGAACDVLRQLDDRTLRDLGFHRSEITSVVAEVSGQTERTRMRALPNLHEWPI